MAAAVSSEPRLTFFANDGSPLAGGNVYTYAAGTLTPKTFYSNEAKSIAVSNPIVLNAAGRPQASAVDTTEVNLYYTGSAKFVVKDSLGSTIYTADNIEEVAVAGSSTLAFPVTVTGGVSGGIPGFTSTTTMAASALLAAHSPVIGGGAGATPTTITAGTNNQILAGVTSGDPLFRAMVLADMPILSARLTATVTASATSTLATLTDLSLTPLGSTNYTYKLVLFTTGDTTGGVKIALAGTAVVASLRMNVFAWNEASAGSPLIATVFTSTTLTSNTTSGTGSGFNTSCFIVEGTIGITTGGTLLLQFAQSTGSGVSTAILGSYVQLIPTSN